MKKRKASPDKVFVKQLVESFKHGNQHAFEQLTECFDDAIDRYLFNRGVKCREDREDLRQSIWCAAAMQIMAGKYREEDHFDTWLSSMTFRHAATYIRRKKYRQVDEHRYLQESDNAHNELPHGITAEQLLIGIHFLTAKEQMVVHKYHYEDMKFRDIAEQANLKLSNVTVTHSRAMARLRKIFVK